MCEKKCVAPNLFHFLNMSPQSRSNEMWAGASRYLQKERWGELLESLWRQDKSSSSSSLSFASANVK